MRQRALQKVELARGVENDPSRLGKRDEDGVLQSCGRDEIDECGGE